MDRDQALPLQRGFTARGTRPATEEPGVSRSSEQGSPEPTTATTRDSPAGPQPGCDVMSCITSVTQATPTHAQSSSSSSLQLSNGEASQTLRPVITAKCCVPHRTGRRTLQMPDTAPRSTFSSSSSSSSALFTSSQTERLAPARTEPDRSPLCSTVVHHHHHHVTTQWLPLLVGSGGDGGPPPSTTHRSPSTSEGTRLLLLDRPEVSGAEEVHLASPGVVVSAPPTEELPDSPMFLRGRTITDSIGELAAVGDFIC